MAWSKQLKHGPKEKELRYFDEKLNLNETAEHQIQQTHMQWQLLMNQCHTAEHEGDGGRKVQYNQYCELHGRMEEPEDHRDKEAQGYGEMAPKAKPVHGCVNHLLILAQSAEIVAQSEDDHNKESNTNLVDQVSQENGGNITADDSRESSQRSGFCHEVSMPRLTEIRKQARHKYLLLDQERIEDSQGKDVHGKTVRLNQIKRQARCKIKNDLLLQRLTEGHKDENLQAELIRLTQMKHLARLKGKSTAKERTEEHVNGHEGCNKFEENKNDKVLARQFEQDICQEGNLIEITSGKGQEMTHFKANSERQKEFNCLRGRMRLTHLRREVRFKNQCYVGQGSAET